MLHHLEDIRSDLSVLHRVDDLEAMPADRFWRLAERLWCYPGAVSTLQRVRVPDTPPVTPLDDPARVPSMAPIVTADQTHIDGLLRTEMYGEVPGLAAVFSHSTAPLAPDPEGDSDDGGRDG